MTFPEKLKAERERLKLSRPQADEAIGLSKGQFQVWETERNVPHRIMQEGVLRELKAIKTPKKTKP